MRKTSEHSMDGPFISVLTFLTNLMWVLERNTSFVKTVSLLPCWEFMHPAGIIQYKRGQVFLFLKRLQGCKCRYSKTRHCLLMQNLSHSLQLPRNKCFTPSTSPAKRFPNMTPGNIKQKSSFVKDQKVTWKLTGLKLKIILLEYLQTNLENFMVSPLIFQLA